jgi:acyl CoA:acetate/3-ketoacid CoA transferase alpha subunit
MQRTKLTPLAEAAARVPDGAHVALGGFAIARNAGAFARELIRQGRRGLTVSQGICGLESDLLAGAGCVERLIYGGGSLDKFGLLICINRLIEQRRIVAEAYSGLALTFKFLAGALGLPFLPIRSIRATDILARVREVAPDQVGEVTCPFTGESLLALRALQPDVAVIQVQEADALGNARIYGPRWDNWEAARAAQRVIIIAETIVSTDIIRQQPELTLIPGHRVEAVVPLAYGAHPTALYRCYDYDAEHLQEYADAAKDAAGLPRYLDKYVFGPADHEAYLARAGGRERLARLATAASGAAVRA